VVRMGFICSLFGCGIVNFGRGSSFRGPAGREKPLTFPPVLISCLRKALR
jgi:hypothetical protein